MCISIDLKSCLHAYNWNLTMWWCFEYKRIKFQCQKGSEFSHFSGPRGLTPSPPLRWSSSYIDLFLTTILKIWRHLYSPPPLLRKIVEATNPQVYFTCFTVHHCHDFPKGCATAFAQMVLRNKAWRRDAVCWQGHANLCLRFLKFVSLYGHRGPLFFLTYFPSVLFTLPKWDK